MNGQPLNYTTRQVQDVKNGMTRREFLEKYGNTLRTNNTFYKIQRLSPLSNVKNKPKTEPVFSRNYGNIQNVSKSTFSRAETLLGLMNNDIKRAHEIHNFHYLLAHGMITKDMGFYKVTEVGKNFVEAILDNSKGFCNNCKEIKPLDHFHKSSIKYQGRGGIYCKTCKQKHYSENLYSNEYTPKVSLAIKIWNSVKKLFPKLVWE